MLKKNCDMSIVGNTQHFLLFCYHMQVTFFAFSCEFCNKYQFFQFSQKFDEFSYMSRINEIMSQLFLFFRFSLSKQDFRIGNFRSAGPSTIHVGKNKRKYLIKYILIVFQFLFSSQPAPFPLLPYICTSLFILQLSQVS